MKTYFMSYSRADADLALGFAKALIEAGVPVWVDQYDIQPSQHWDRAVETAVRGCRGMLVMLSPRSVASPNVLDEISVAIDEGKDVVPVLLERCSLPLRLTRMQFIDATRDVPGAVRKCADHILRNDRRDGPRASLEPTAGEIVPPGLPQAVITLAERRLIGILGPIASVLVKREAARTTSEVDLYRALSRAIAQDPEREAFLKWVSGSSGPVEEPGGANASQSFDRERLCTALTRQLGPIAGRLIDREFAGEGSVVAKVQRLAARIASERDRATFLRDAGF